ncbi:inosine/xanthosine triphosphatase [Maribellus sp. YY47]|uniref:inosine/xanthosine triphosphatase n=1 Tax=Maribellus sp. YY47 TaxID=2929486 RepID=UPI002000B968|nr:inosine/xanthosine triphosphatase [Maribellus sp. YY47]
MKIIVASKNPVKINATLEGFGDFFDEVSVEGVSVESGVSDQPMSDEETLAGARNRVANAQKLFPGADFWIGVEGGLQREAEGLVAFAWIVITDGSQKGESRTTSFMLPPKVALLVESGYELGTANDMVFKQHNSKQKSGAVGLLTGDKIDRTQLYRQAVQLALIPFLNKELYSPSFR